MVTRASRRRRFRGSSGHATRNGSPSGSSNTRSAATARGSHPANGRGVRRFGGAFTDWSPNSRDFLVDRDGSTYIVNRITRAERFLVEGGGALWSPNGTRIAFSCDRPDRPSAAATTGSSRWTRAVAEDSSWGRIGSRSPCSSPQPGLGTRRGSRTTKAPRSTAIRTMALSSSPPTGASRPSSSVTGRARSRGRPPVPGSRHGIV